MEIFDGLLGGQRDGYAQHNDADLFNEFAPVVNEFWLVDVHISLLWRFLGRGVAHRALPEKSGMAFTTLSISAGMAPSCPLP